MPDAVPARLPLRRNRDFAVLWAGQAVSEIGNTMSALVVPLIGYAITGSTTQAGWAATAALLGTTFARLPAGALVDRWPRGRVLVAANLVGAVCYGSLAVATLAHRLTLAQLVAAAFVSGVSAAFFAPATSAAVRTVVDRADLPVALSRQEARDHGAQLVGPPLGGALYTVARGLPFLVDAVSYVVGAASVWFVRTPLPAPERSQQRIMGDVGEGLAYLWKQTAVRAIMLWGGLINFAGALVFATVTLRLVRAGVHPALIGLVETIAAVAGLAGALVAPVIVRRVPTGLMTAVTGLVVAAIFVPMAWATQVSVIGALFAVGTFLLPANNTGISAYMTSVVPDRLQGRVHAAAGLLAGSLYPFAPAVAGTLLGSVGSTATTLLGAGCTALSLLPLLATREVRALGRPDTWPKAADPNPDPADPDPADPDPARTG
jgi:MFS family permease